MSEKCSVNIAKMPEIADPGCGTKLFVIGPDGKGYYIRIDDLWEACPPLRIRQKVWAAPGSGTLATMPGHHWPSDMERVMLYYNGQLLGETSVGGSDWTATGTEGIEYPAGFSGGELQIVIFKLRGE